VIQTWLLDRACPVLLSMAAVWSCTMTPVSHLDAAPTPCTCTFTRKHGQADCADAAICSTVVTTMNGPFVVPSRLCDVCQQEAFREFDDAGNDQPVCACNGCVSVVTSSVFTSCEQACQTCGVCCGIQSPP
jgi:hypothetical protein